MSSSIPKTQTVAQIEAYGGAEVVQLKKDAPVPEIKPTELLIKNEYAGINFIDIVCLSLLTSPLRTLIAPSTSATASTKSRPSHSL